MEYGCSVAKAAKWLQADQATVLRARQKGAIDSTRSRDCSVATNWSMRTGGGSSTIATAVG